jgi:carbon storage regulator
MKDFNGLRWNMLVLTRRVDESIRIGDDIRITVVKIKGTQQICVGVDAPRDVPVLREELLVERVEVIDEPESSNS